ncbi:NAD-dependent epimerase/dehydratase family protein [Myroides odoratus]|uniref:NAD-dependent epimerase/dehydratase family protein n=1 Tax=Myroides odoratus TaxID=256 RepID=UPI000765BF52|nr:NAD-dependent epimerase/dehydratase family protein [Myroides odoratus]
MKVIITGATGMVGEGVLQECIASPTVTNILLINRKPSGYAGDKVEEILHSDFNDISPIGEKLKGYDACYFCAGISSVGVTEEEYRKFTYALTINFATVLADINPKMTFCYVSGGGTDSTERGRTMWARIKGMTENDLMKLPFKAVFNFRPAFMRPTKDAKNVKGFYKIIDVLYPLLRIFSKTFFLTLQEVGKAMINVTANGYEKNILETKDILLLNIKK